MTAFRPMDALALASLDAGFSAGRERPEATAADPLAGWLAARTIAPPADFHWTSAGDLYADYLNWAERVGARPMSRKAFAHHLLAAGKILEYRRPLNECAHVRFWNLALAEADPRPDRRRATPLVTRRPFDPANSPAPLYETIISLQDDEAGPGDFDRAMDRVIGWLFFGGLATLIFLIGLAVYGLPPAVG